jgi:hypothetical protein
MDHLPQLPKLKTHVLHSSEHVAMRLHKRFHLGDAHFDPNSWNDYLVLYEHFNVHILATYRRYYEWLTSVKSKKSKMSVGGYRNPLSKWPDAGGTTIQPIMPDLIKYDKRHPYPYTDAIKGYFEGVVPLRLVNNHAIQHNHAGIGILLNFVCNAVDAKLACNELMQRETSDAVAAKVNAHEDLFYNMIAYTAYERGILVTNKTRLKVVTAIADRQVSKGLGQYDFPLDCPTREEVTWILTRSLKYEEELFPAFHAQQEQEYRDSFNGRGVGLAKAAVE